MKKLFFLSLVFIISCQYNTKNQKDYSDNFNHKNIEMCRYNDYPINMFLIKDNIIGYNKRYKKESLSENKEILSVFKKLTTNKNLDILHFAAVGDILPHGMVKKTALLGKKGVEDFDYLFRETKDDIKKADIAFGNLETPFYPTTKEMAYKSIPYKFNIPIKMLKTLKKVGFDILNIANNHLYDQGVKGIVTTVKELKKEGFLFSGAGRNYNEATKPIIFTKKGIKIGLISFTTWINNDKNKYDPLNPNKTLKKRPYLNKYIPKETKKLVKKLKKEVDFVIVSMHWGHEYHKDPSFEQKKKVKLLFKAGADLILGHHPHVLQKTIYRADKKAVIYSMGNFVSNQFFIVRSRHKRNKFANREGVIWNIDIKKDKKSTKIIKLEQIPLYLQKEELKPKKENNYRIYIHKLEKKEKEYKSIYKFLKPKVDKKVKK